MKPLLAAAGVVGGALLLRRVFRSSTSTVATSAVSDVKNQGVPFASPTGQVWPVVGGNKEVPFLGIDGKVYGNGSTRFGASREDGERNHAGIDLQAASGQRIVAMEPGIVLGNIPGFVKLDAMVVQHSSVVAVYAEVKSVGLVAGTRVRAGQLVALGALNYEGNSMLHLELWAIGRAPKSYTPWYRGKPPPPGLLDPTVYLRMLARRT